MGVYERWVLPRMLDLAMRNKLLDHYRQRTIETARGLVLEVGVGSGLNLRFYGRAVDRVCGIDLSPELLRLAHERTADAVVRVSLIRVSAEHLPFDVAVFDAGGRGCPHHLGTAGRTRRRQRSLASVGRVPDQVEGRSAIGQHPAKFAIQVGILRW